MRFSAIAKANINAISSAPGHGNGHSPTVAASSSSYLTPSSSQARRKSSVSFREPENEGDAEAKTKEKAAIKERAKARLTVDVPSTPRTPSTPKTAEIMAEVDGTLEVLRSNMGKLSARGENIEHLEARTEGLVKSAKAFKRTTKHVRREMQWKELKMRLIIGFVIVVVLSLTIISIVQAVRNSQAQWAEPTVVAVVSVPPYAAPTPTDGNTHPTGTVAATLATPAPTSTKSKLVPAPAPLFIGQEPETVPESGLGSEASEAGEVHDGWAEGASKAREIEERDWWWLEDLME